MNLTAMTRLPRALGTSGLRAVPSEVTWVVGTIPPGGTTSPMTFDTTLHSGRRSEANSNMWPGRVGAITATASSLSPEPGILLANNAAQVYSFAAFPTALTYHMRGGRLALLLSVDDRRPEAGGDVNFNLTAENAYAGVALSNDYSNIITDINIKVELSEGLEFKTGWNPPKVTVPQTGRRQPGNRGSGPKGRPF